VKPILTMKWFNRRSSGRARVLARREQVCIAAEAKTLDLGIRWRPRTIPRPRDGDAIPPGYGLEFNQSLLTNQQTTPNQEP